jgi:hypothetical protein
MKLLLCFLADIIITSSPLPLAACIFYICIFHVSPVTVLVLFPTSFSFINSCILFPNQNNKTGKEKMKPEREKEIRPGERERSGGAPEREGGAARGRSDGARGCDGGSKVISRRPERTIWSGSATAVGDGSGLSSLLFPYFVLLFGTLVLIWEW